MDNQKVKRGSPDRFGYEWARYSDVLEESRAQLERWLGSDSLATFAGKTVLDVGCGMGRNPYWVAKSGATSVTAVDVDDNSLTAARKNLKNIANVSVKKCSVYDLDPEVLGRFDRVVAIGVVHHLDDPPLALQRLWSCVQPGGALIFWVYGKEGNRLILPAIHIMRAFGSRLPIQATHACAKVITLLAWPFIKHLPWRNEYYRNLRTLSFKNVESIIFDQMLPHIAHYWTEGEVSALIAPLGGNASVEFVQGNSWHVRVQKAR